VHDAHKFVEKLLYISLPSFIYISMQHKRVTTIITYKIHTTKKRNITNVELQICMLENKNDET